MAPQSQPPVPTSSPPFGSIEWLLPLFSSFIIFENHYARDSVGAVEIQMESNIANFSADNYALMNSLFFVPSMIAPLLAGMFATTFGGPPRLQFYAVFSAAIGHIIFSFGVQYGSISLILLGRFIAGFMYEIIDMTPIVILFPMFAASQGLMVGLINGMLRLGSVANFLITPAIYQVAGISAALWVSTLVATITTLFSVGILFVLRIMEKRVQGDAAVRITTPTLSPILSTGGLTTDDNDEVELVFDSSSQDSRKSNDEPTGEFVINNTYRRPMASVVWRVLADALPLHTFGRQYYLFLFSGMFLYGSIVPFWFIASGWLQLTYHLPLKIADGLTVLPEGMIAIVSVPVGMLIDRFQCTTKTKLRLLSVSCMMLPVGYLLLVWGAESEGFDEAAHTQAIATHHSGAFDLLGPFSYPTLVMIFLGLSYALSNCFLWSTINDVLPIASTRPAANGLIACGLNVLPSVVPPLITSTLRTLLSSKNSVYLHDMFPLFLLAALAQISSVLAWVTSTLSADESAADPTGASANHRFARVGLDESQHPAAA